MLEDRHMKNGPYVCTLENGNLSVCDKSHIVLTNIHQLATNVDKWLKKFPENFFDLIIVDEAHHSAAASWKRVFTRFPNAKIVNLTATPFRSDQQELEGELIFRYPVQEREHQGIRQEAEGQLRGPKQAHLYGEGGGAHLHPR